MERARGSLTVKAQDKDLEISNSRIRIRLFFRDGGYAQEFYAIDSRGRFQLILASLHKDLIPFSDFRTCSSPMIAGERQHLFGICRESLRMVYSNAEILHHDEQSIELSLSGSIQQHTLDCHITLQADSNLVHIRVTDKFGQSGRPPLIEYVMSSFAFMPGGRPIGSTSELDYAWVPALRPGNGCVIGDCTFHSPALILQHGSNAAALVPDLGLLQEHRPMPAALDLDLDNGLLFAPLLSYGFCGYERDTDDNSCKHDVTMARRIPDRQLVYGYDLLLDASCKRGSAKQNVARFMWEKYGAPKLKIIYTGVGPNHTSRPASYSHTVTDARSAYGLYNFGVENGNEYMMCAFGKAEDAILSIPQNSGLFATRFDSVLSEWDGCNISDGDGYYHTVECSEQLYWLLKSNSDIKHDPRIIRFCRRYADFLIESRLRTGAIPSWYTRDLHPTPTLRSSIQTAASVVFLAELARATRLVKYRSAAERSANFVISKLMPTQEYLDHTLIDHRRRCNMECSDPHSGSQPKSGRGMLWAAEMCLALYRLTGHKKYIDAGTDVLDQLCLLQSVWNKPWEPSPGFGMLASNNIGADYNPELTVDFAHCALGYAAITGIEEYAQRGEAALRSIRGIIDCTIQARIASIEKQFGSVYVHIGKKWTVCTNGVSIQDVEYFRGGLRLQVLNKDTASVVFGGMRGNSYKLSINNREQTLSREQMEAGVSIPANTKLGEDTREKQPALIQPNLFD